MAIWFIIIIIIIIVIIVTIIIIIIISFTSTETLSSVKEVRKIDLCHHLYIYPRPAASWTNSPLLVTLSLHRLDHISQARQNLLILEQTSKQNQTITINYAYYIYIYICYQICMTNLTLST